MGLTRVFYRLSRTRIGSSVDRFEIPSIYAGSDAVAGCGTTLARARKLAGVVVGARIGSFSNRIMPISPGYRSGGAGATGRGCGGGQPTACRSGVPGSERRDWGAQIKLSEIGLVRLETQ